MIRVVIGTVWSSLFALLGLALGTAVDHHIVPAWQFTHRGLLPLLGIIVGLTGFNFFWQRQWLAGLPGGGVAIYKQPVTERRWGVLQAVWLLVGFIVMQGVGVAGLAAVVGVCGVLAHIQPLPHLNAIAATLAGYLTASLWSIWYINRLGPLKLHDGSPSGVAWCPALADSYLTAALFAGLIVMSVVVIMHFFPPDMVALQKLQAAKLFETPGLWKLGLLVLAVFIAPPVEEYVFRGGIFSALASRVSPLWAGVITTLLFVAVHAPEKIHYPAGFIDVGLVGAVEAWMRVRFQSIKPGVLLHVLYNAGLMLAAGLAH
jgi:membrane protease YdiL (CAAX protease family)